MILQTIFFVISTVSLLLFFYATGKDKSVLLSGILWMVVVGVVSGSGYLQNIRSLPPRFVWIIVPAVCLSIVTYRTLRPNKTNIRYLLAIHLLRLPVELVLYELYLRKQIPVEMTFEGWNFDIVTGFSAGLMLIYILSGKRLSCVVLAIWNAAGLVLLSAVAIIAILSSPMPFQQLSFDQPNVAVLAFPFIYLPSLVVPIVFLSHLLILKNYIAKSE